MHSGTFYKQLFLHEIHRHNEDYQNKTLATYPGIKWFLLLTVGPALIYEIGYRFHVGWYKTEIDINSFLVLVTILQITLYSVRSVLYASVSTSEELQNNTLQVLLSTPISLPKALAIKLGACLVPVWMELSLLFPFNFVYYHLFKGADPKLVFILTYYLFVLTIIFGTLGLWLGSINASPHQTAYTAKLIALILLWGTLAQNDIIPIPITIILMTIMIWNWLLKPASSLVGVSFLILLPLAYHLLTYYCCPYFELSAYNPIKATYELSYPQPSYHLTPELINKAKHIAERDAVSFKAAFSKISADIPKPDLKKRAELHLIFTSLTYLLMSVLLFYFCLRNLKHKI